MRGDRARIRGLFRVLGVAEAGRALLDEGDHAFAEVAGLGGEVNYIKTTTDYRGYKEVFPDIIGILHLQGGYVSGWGGKDLRMLDHFQMGPSLVRGFAPSGIGPRDLSQLNFTGYQGDALGGSMYWGASVEFQTPLYFLPKDSGVRVAAFADALASTSALIETLTLACAATPPPALVSAVASVGTASSAANANARRRIVYPLFA